MILNKDKLKTVIPDTKIEEEELTSKRETLGEANEWL
jgi:hypothetical protein